MSDDELSIYDEYPEDLYCPGCGVPYAPDDGNELCETCRRDPYLDGSR